MADLEDQKKHLLDEIKLSKVDNSLKLTREHILFFLMKFRDMDLNDADCRQKLFDTFVNSIFVYDDKIVLTFNYSGDSRQITLTELDFAESAFVSSAQSSTITRRHELYIVVVRNVFALRIQTESC